MPHQDKSFIAVLSVLCVLIIFSLSIVIFMQETIKTIGLKLGDEWLIPKLMLLVMLVAVLFFMILRLLDSGAKTGMEVLKERLAKGEITEDEFDSLSRKMRAVK